MPKTSKIKQLTKKNKTTELKEETFIFACGRRKEATTRVRLYPNKKGEIIVNNQPIEKYFPGEWMKGLYLAPLRTCNVIGKYFFSIKVEGSGLMGQLNAVVHGMSRALAILEPEKFRSLLRRKGFLTRDPRKRERRKVGMGGKARRKKQSPKR